MSSQHIDNLCVILTDFDIWSGQTRLSATDLKLGVGGELPPERVAQLGSKKVCDPEHLKGFHRLKTETRRFLLRHGMPFMNGYAVPVSKKDEITEKLATVTTEFYAISKRFIDDYEKAVEDWVMEHPDFSAAIRAGALPKKDVERRIGFDYQVFMIQPVGDDEVAREKLNGKVASLAGDLVSEVVDEATKFYDRHLAGREQCGIATKLTLRKIRDKVDGLSFLSNSFSPLVNMLDETLKGYEQAEGRNVVAPFFYQLVASVAIMSDRRKIEQYANREITVESVARTVSPNDLAVEEAVVSPVSDRSFTNQISNEIQSGISPLDDLDEGLDEDIDAWFHQYRDEGTGSISVDTDTQMRSVHVSDPVSTPVEVESVDVGLSNSSQNLLEQLQNTGTDNYF